jgi:hypothetical protein
LALVGSAVLLLLAVFGLAFVPDRQRFRFDLRGIQIGDRLVPAERVNGVWVENGRLVVEDRDGVRHRSALLSDASQLEPLIAQYQRLSTVKQQRMPADVRRLVGSARKE